jgi:mannose-6-phosphate isomerase
MTGIDAVHAVHPDQAGGGGRGPDGQVAQAFHTFREWMLAHALPFWAGAGRDAPGLGMRESLTLEGRPADVPFKRMRVQARQMYVFSHAALLGWDAGEAVARNIYGFICQKGRRLEGGWVRRLDRSGMVVLDATADLYDQAFVLFGLAWYARLTRDSTALDEARQTADWIRAEMRGPLEGYLNTLPVEPGWRQQNPHMHLLEAALALFETSADPYWRDWAMELVALFESRLLDRGTGTLGEFFTDAWSPAPGPPGDHIEPGHHYEWTWLLHQHARLTGQDRRNLADTVFGFAEAHGLDDRSGRVLDVVGRTGTIHSAATRLWPQTEALKAYCTMAAFRTGLEPRIAAIVRDLMTGFFSGCPAGTWRDRFDAKGQCSVDGIPSSSLYHVFTAYAELSAFVEGGTAKTLRTSTPSRAG